MSKKLKINIGDKFNKLTIIKEVDSIILPSGQPNRAFECLCDCGNYTIVRLVHLVRNRIMSCGCNLTTSGKPKHHKSGTKLYTIWRGIKNRTSSKNYVDASIYFDRGITMFDEWKNDFELFYKWSIDNGYSEGLQLDRKDNDKGYFPDNCRFVTPKFNQNNRRNNVIVEYNGCKYPFMILIENKNLNRQKQTIINRIKNGWSIEKAFDTPVKEGNYRTK